MNELYSKYSSGSTIWDWLRVYKTKERVVKCDTCKHKEHHSPGSADDVINHGDDPYDYDYCEFLYWVDNLLEDPGFDAEKCESYEKKSQESS